MDPPPDSPAFSDDVSYGNISFYDSTPGNLADQQRLTAVIRIHETSGVYVDIYRSSCRGGGPQQHDYLYHNLSDSKPFFAAPDGQPLSMSPATDLDLHAVPDDSTNGPGYDYFSELTKATVSSPVSADFTFTDPGKSPVHMRCWLNGGSNRTYFAATTPYAPTAPASVKFNNLHALVARQSTGAASHPFVAVYEPFKNGFPALQSVRYEGAAASEGDLVVVRIVPVSQGGFDGGEIIALAATNHSATHTHDGLFFQGTYGVVSSNRAGMRYLYMGNANRLTASRWSLRMAAGVKGNANLANNNGKQIINATASVTVSFPWSNPDRNVAYTNYQIYYEQQGRLLPAGNSTAVPDTGVATKGNGQITGTVPAGDLPLRILPTGLRTVPIRVER